MRKFFHLFICCLFIGFHITYAEDTPSISKDGLVVEYLFSGSSIEDTSLTPKKTTMEGGVPIQKESKLGFNYIELGTGTKIKANMGWSAGVYGSYTISFWYKGIDNTYMSPAPYTSKIQNIVNSNNGRVLGYDSTNNNTSTIIRNYYLLNNSSNVYGMIFDDKWHHIIIRKNGLYNKMYVDGKIIFDEKMSIGDIGYNLELGGGNVNVGKLAKFRLYNRDLTLDELKNLYTEFAYVGTSSVQKIDTTTNLLTDNEKKILSDSGYLLGFKVSTKLTDRNNPNNIGDFRRNNTAANSPQTLFSTNYNDQKENIYLVLDANYTCFVPYGSFDCSVLKDEKEHIFIIRKDKDNNSIYIDGNQVIQKIDSKGKYGSQISFGNSSFISTTLEPNSSKSSYYCKGFYIANGGYVCDEKSEFLGKFYAYTPSNDIHFGIENFHQFVLQESTKTTLLTTKSGSYNKLSANLNNYVNNTLTLDISGIDSVTSYDKIKYLYSWDGINFMEISTGSFQTYSSGYLVNISTSELPFGNLNLTIKIKDGPLEKIISKITTRKEDDGLDIMINEPDSTVSESKTISATFSQGNLYMSIVKVGTICNQTLTFEDYSPLTFTSEFNNGYKICYKGVNSLSSQVVYKLSNEIQGIKATESYFGSTMFDTYKNWKYSKQPKENDTTFVALGLIGMSSSVSTKSGSSPTYNYVNGGTQLVDINGDGLVDLLYNLDNKRAILINSGDLSFKITYKCVIDNGYYGDCAE